ncbi:MAG TPA: HYR domain-containing protein [Candidatus Eisenbacteria bacterium]
MSTSRVCIAALAVLVMVLLGPALAAAQCGPWRMDGCLKDITVVGCEPGGAHVDYVPPTAHNDCGPIPAILYYGPPPGSLFPFGTTTVEYWTGLDENGNFDSCVFDVIVLAPERHITQGKNITVTGCDPGGAVVTYPMPTAWDDCGPLTPELISGYPPGSVFPFGTTTVEWWTNTNPDGQWETTVFEVNVLVPEKQITCVNNIFVTGCVGGAVITYEEPVITDACGTRPAELYQGYRSGSVFPTGPTTVEWWSGLDANNEFVTCVFEVTVDDDTKPPVIDCPEIVVATAPAGQSSAIVHFDVSATDSCGGAVTLDFQPPDGSSFPCGTTPVTVTARDPMGNIDTCTFDVTVASTVPLDVRPGDCPNQLNLNANAAVPVAIMGSSLFDIARIDPASLRLEGVAPMRWSLDDVGAPYSPFTGKDDCEDCNRAKKDRIADFSMKFDGAELREAMGDAMPGECRVLRLTGQTIDGCPIAGEDVVRIKHIANAAISIEPGTSPVGTALHAIRPNPVVNAAGFAWEMETAAHASITIFDIAGRRVRQLADGWQGAGQHEAEWDVRDELGMPVPNGVYLYALTVDDGTGRRFVRKLIVSR